MQSTIPISTLHLIPAIDRLLLDLLTSLSPEDWELPTPSKAWNVKAVASHLLDGTLRAMSFSRDDYRPVVRPASDSYQDVVQFLNMVNRKGVEAMQMYSPALITELLSLVNPIYATHLHTLDLFAPSIFPVSWAGQSSSPNWFHIAREYTEKWHHQQQIRSAVDDHETLLEDRFFLPYLDTSLHACLHGLRDAKASEGDYLQLIIQGPGEVQRFLHYNSVGWVIAQTPSSNLVSVLRIPKEIIWRIFSKEITPEEAAQQSDYVGDKIFAEKIWQAVAVMA